MVVAHRWRTAVLGFLMALSGCASAAPPSLQASNAALTGDAYALDAGDKLRITVFGEETLTGEYSVTSSGNVAFPLIGSVKASGQTIEAVEETIRTRLAGGYVKDPRVSVEVLNYRPFYILGEVGKPGEYPFVNGMTIEQAVAAAGGFTYRANTKRVFLRRRAGDQAERTVDLRGKPIPVLPGDTIRVSERYF